MEQYLTLLEECPSKDLDSSIIYDTICTVYKGLEREKYSLLRQTNIKARWSAKKIATGENANQTRGYVTET